MLPSSKNSNFSLCTTDVLASKISKLLIGLIFFANEHVRIFLERIPTSNKIGKKVTIFRTRAQWHFEAILSILRAEIGVVSDPGEHNSSWFFFFGAHFLNTKLKLRNSHTNPLKTR